MFRLTTRQWNDLKILINGRRLGAEDIVDMEESRDMGGVLIGRRGLFFGIVVGILGQSASSRVATRTGSCSSARGFLAATLGSHVVGFSAIETEFVFETAVFLGLGDSSKCGARFFSGVQVNLSSLRLFMLRGGSAHVSLPRALFPNSGGVIQSVKAIELACLCCEAF